MPLADELHAAPDLKTALRAVISHLRAEGGTIHVLKSDGLLHLSVASEGMPQGVLDAIRTVPVGKGMAGLAAQRREAVTACNIQTDGSGDVRPGARATGLLGAIVVPMFGEGERVVGTLGVANSRERTFSEDEQRMLIDAGRILAQRLHQPHA